MSIPIFLRDERTNLSANYLLGRIVKNALGRRVKEANSPIGIDGDDGIGRCLGQTSETLLALPQPFLRLPNSVEEGGRPGRSRPP